MFRLTHSECKSQLPIVCKKAIDTFVVPGSSQNTISIDENSREEFFAKNPAVKKLLLEAKCNPLLEEGKINGNQRERKGEFYIPAAGIELLVAQKIRDHETKADGLAYNTDNIFVIDNDEKQLNHILQNLNLSENKDAKFIFISQIHAIPFYLRNVDGHIKCFIIDSQPNLTNMNIAKMIRNQFEHSFITFSSTHLQKDFYSCSTFAIKALMYFCKHGATIFSYIENMKPSYDAKTDTYVLSEDKLMPALLKMSQSKLSLSEAALDTIVSYKTKTTLREYLKKYSVNVKDNVYNAAALVKKYGYFAELNAVLTVKDIDLSLTELSSNTSNKGSKC